MDFDIKVFEATLNQALKVYEKQQVVDLCNNLSSIIIKTPQLVPVKNIETILQKLRNKRKFAQMQQIGDACLISGIETLKVRRQYVQSLIDQGNYAPAISMANLLVNDTKDENTATAIGEYKEARGLLGRIYKQLYANNPDPESAVSRGFIEKSVGIYYEVYKESPEGALWHGINVVALLKRAGRDGILLQGYPAPEKIAGEIMEILVNRFDSAEATMQWDYATAIEAALSLDLPDDAIEWAKKYLSHPGTDDFEIASTERQLREIWQLNEDSNPGQYIIPLFKAYYLKKDGTQILVQNNQGSKAMKPAEMKQFEKVFGADSFKTYKWYLKGVGCCNAVVRIGKEAGKGFGTGFILDGKSLHPSLEGNFVLITNAHVASPHPELNNNSLRAEECVVIFETIKAEEELRIEKIFWSSGINELDVSVLLFDEESHNLVKKWIAKKTIVPYKISRHLPLNDGTQRVYIIGHPGGGTLQISLQDNLLLYHKDPFLHYRAPTEGGSSGSPVFNDQWELIAVHHAGSDEMEKLDGSGELYEANEGIWIMSVMEKMKKELL